VADFRVPESSDISWFVAPGSLLLASEPCFWLLASAFLLYSSPLNRRFRVGLSCLLPADRID